MVWHTLAVEVPAEFVALVASPKETAAKARQALVLDMLREGGISQGQAARLLGITRWDILDLMARYGVPSGPETPEEMQEEIDYVRGSIACW